MFAKALLSGACLRVCGRFYCKHSLNCIKTCSITTMSRYNLTENKSNGAKLNQMTNFSTLCSKNNRLIQCKNKNQMILKRDFNIYIWLMGCVALSAKDMEYIAPILFIAAFFL